MICIIAAIASLYFAAKYNQSALVAVAAAFIIFQLCSKYSSSFGIEGMCIQCGCQDCSCYGSVVNQPSNFPMGYDGPYEDAPAETLPSPYEPYSNL